MLLLLTIYEIEKHERDVFPDVNGKYIPICIYSNNLKIDASIRQMKTNICQPVLSHIFLTCIYVPVHQSNLIASQ